MLVAVAPPLALLAVTVTAKVPAGVPGVCVSAGVFILTPHAASRSNAATAIPAANLSLSFLVCQLSTVAMMLRSASSAAYGSIGHGSRGENTTDFAVVAMLMVTGEVVVTDGGLKLHVAPAGSPLQAKVIAPSPLPLLVTFRIEVAVPPAATLTVAVCAESSRAASICVTSLAVSLAVLLSPPPETLAVLVTEDAALLATFTVRVIGSKLVPAASTSPRVHCSGESVQFQFRPLRSVAVSPAGRLTFTVTRAEVSAALLETVIV